MKLFLSSEAIFGNLATEFARLVGKNPQDIKLALIENAADVYAEDKIAWVYENRASFTDAGLDVELIDLRDYQGQSDELKAKLSRKDAVWLNGGNTFYLRWILKESGADSVILELVKKGLVYGGGSAGALVAGPTLKHIEEADDPADAPEVIWDGMHLSETVVMPHMQNEKYGHVMQKAVDALKIDGYGVISITDDQAVVVSGSESHVVNT